MCITLGLLLYLYIQIYFRFGLYVTIGMLGKMFLGSRKKGVKRSFTTYYVGSSFFSHTHKCVIREQ